MFDTSQPTFGTFEDRAVWLIGLLLGDFPKIGLNGALGFAGNFGRESVIQMIQEGRTLPGGWPGITPGGWGPPQWTGPRRTAFADYCTRSGRDPNALSTGYAYTFVELDKDYAKVIDLLAGVATVEDAVSIVEQHYEMAGVVAMSDRLAFAVRAQKAWEAHVATSPSPATTPAPPPPHTTPAPTTTPPPAKGNPAMGTFITLLLPMIEKYIQDNISSIGPVILTEIEKWAESLFTKVNNANPATPTKTIVSS